MSIVYGNNVNLFVEVAGNNQAITCGRTCTLNINTEILERTTPESGKFKQFKGVAISGSMSFEGDVFYSANYGVQDLINWQLALAPVICSYETIAENLTSKTYLTHGIIENVTYTGPIDAPASFSVNIILDGDITPL